MNAVFLRSAELDLQELRQYLVQNFGTKTWRASLRKIQDTVAAIEQHPRLGMVPPELEELQMVQYRQVLSGSNRIIYELRGDTAYIHVVCDARRDLKSLLLRRLVRGHRP
ncbi:type II toxin-antitoxin system RelE/ParE family toxin [Paracidovorax sp. MALMAid1276]|uniref:type II toxin-antitoxin system RelE/ParE family toxin n=1 Tax=Paracidovorax sp. MALMAid1276 TaxID=3411631 RepID=UPI003B9C21B8